MLLHSTVGLVNRSFEKAAPLRGLVAAASYALPRRAFVLGEDTKPLESMTRPGFLECPYVYKEIGYEFEEEIRFIFAVNPDLASQKSTLNGILIEIDFLSIVNWSGVELSPDIQETERHAIGTVIQSLDMGKMQRLLDIEKELEAGVPNESPFTMFDEPEGLFPDLD